MALLSAPAEGYPSNAFKSYARCMDDIALPNTSRLSARDLRLVLALAMPAPPLPRPRACTSRNPRWSRALLGVEHKLDLKLFDRTPRGLEPTEAGRLLWRALRAVERVERG